MAPQRTGQQTRQRLLAATATVAADQGVAHLTTRHVAARAGVTEATLFKHFPTKRDLLLATVREYLPTFDAVLVDQDGSDSLQDDVTRIATAALTLFRALVPVAIMVLSDTSLLAAQREILRGHRGPADTYERVAAYFLRQQQSGRIDPALDTLALAALLLGPCFQWAFLDALLGTPPLPLDDASFVARVVATLPLATPSFAQTEAC